MDRLLSTAFWVLGSARAPLDRGRASLTSINRALGVVRAADDPEQAYLRKCATHAHTDPTRACFELAKLVTRLPDDLAWRITADQITERAILGCPVPECGRPVVRALEVDEGMIFERLSHDLPLQPVDWDDDPEEDEYALILGTLMQGRSVDVATVSRPVRERLDELGDDDIIDVRHSAYRASQIALYGCFGERHLSPAAALTPTRTNR